MNCYFIGPFELELETLNYELEIELGVRDTPPTNSPCGILLSQWGLRQSRTESDPPRFTVYKNHRRGSIAIKKIDAEDTTCLGEVAAELQMVQRQGVDSDHEESEGESDVSSEEEGEEEDS